MKNRQYSNLFGLLAFLMAGIALLVSIESHFSTALAGPERQETSTSLNQPIGTGALSSVPRTFNYQGVLQKPDGTIAEDGSYRMTFAIYKDLTGGNSLFSETKNAVLVSKGLFSVAIGGGTPSIDIKTVFGDGPRYLGIKVGDDTEMTPRLSIYPVPWALQASALESGAIAYGDMNVDGKVGIGTRAPSQQLHVVGNRIRLQNGAKQLDLRADGGQIDIESTTNSLYLNSGQGKHIFLNPTAQTGDVYIGNGSNQLKVNAYVDFVGPAFSKAGRASNDEFVTPPWGNISEWNIIVSTEFAGIDEPGSNGDNAIVKFYAYALALPSQNEWQIRVRALFRKNGDHDDVYWEPGTATYLIVPK